MFNPSLVACSIAMQANQPIFVVGQPGVAKTSLLTLVGMTFGEIGWLSDVIHPALYEPTDFTGLPIVSKNERGEEIVRFAPPFWAVNAVSMCRERGGHVIIFDEVTCAPPSTQSALMRPVLERRVGDLQMPQTALMVLVGNPPSQAAGGWDIAKPLMNRVCRLNWDLPREAWADYMLTRDPMTNVSTALLPEDWESMNLTAASALVVSYLNVQPTRYSPPIPDKADPLEPFATPRSWDMAAHLIAACKSVGYGMDSHITMRLIGGCVSDPIMLEFTNWVNSQDLPNPEELLKNPSSLKVYPDRDDLNFAVFTNVAATAVGKGDYDSWMAAWEVLGEAANQGKLDIAASASRTLGNHRPTVSPSGGTVLPPASIGKFQKLIDAVRNQERR